MQLTEDIKNYIGRLQLNNQIVQKKVKRKRLSYSHTNYIGILYDAADTANEQLITVYANQLRSENKKVFMLGFFNQKNLPANKKFLLNSEYFWLEKLTSFNLPDRGKVGQFFQQEFDLLINLYLQPILPLQAASAYSKASYRVGAHFSNGLQYVDFMVDIGNNNDIGFLIKQIDFYSKNIT